MKLSYRPYTAADRAACVDIFRSNIPRFFREHEAAEFTNFIDSSACSYFVVLGDQEVVGCGGFGVREGSDTADLCWGMVRSTLHGQHIGEYLLLIRIKAVMETTPCRAVRLGTSQHTDGFYRRYGFTVESVREHAIDTDLHEVEMRLELTDDAKRLIIARCNEVAR